MPDFSVHRQILTPLSTIGKMAIDGVFFCHTLEPPIRQAPAKPRAIPAGQYPLTIRWSTRFGKDMPHVEDVPDFGGIEIHVGNYPQDTEGCLLLGQTVGRDFVGNSIPAFRDFFERLTKALEGGPQKITYYDLPPEIPVGSGDFDAELSG